MIDVMNRFSRLMIGILLRVQKFGKNDGARNFISGMILIKRGAFINDGDEVLFPLLSSNRSFFF